MKVKYQYGFGGIEEIISQDIETVDSSDDLKIKSESKLIIIPKIVGVYQSSEPNPESSKDVLNHLSEDLTNHLFPFLPGETGKTCSDLICIGYDPAVITPEIIMGFLDGVSKKRIKIAE